MPEFKKVILISIDNLRYDCVGYQPDKRELREYGVLKYLETPTLDAIAAKSLCFTNCVSTSTYTTSAHASVFTGLYPPRHGVRAFFDTKLRPDALTLAEVFSTNGYRTICATDVPELFEPLGLTRGFDHFVVRSDAEVFRLLEAYRNERVFLFAHFFDVHEPYLFSECPPAPDYNADYFDLMGDFYRMFNLTITDKRPHALWQNFGQAINRDINYLLRVYVAGVSKFDRGRFRLFVETLKNAGYWDQALTVIFADHGEGRCFYQNRNYFSHSGELYDNVLRVPLLLHAPGLAPKVDHSLSSVVDIFPTVTALAAIRADLPYPLNGINWQDGGGSWPGLRRGLERPQGWQPDGRRKREPAGAGNRGERQCLAPMAAVRADKREEIPIGGQAGGFSGRRQPCVI
jgi:arylsulfatase A-like enzyme